MLAKMFSLLCVRHQQDFKTISTGYNILKHINANWIGDLDKV